MTSSGYLPQVLIIDDHSAVRAGIAQALQGSELDCCGEAASFNEALAQIAHTNPDAIIVDLNLPDGSGLDLIRWVRKRSAETAIVMLTMSDSDADLVAAMRAGASGFVKKSAPLGEVISVLKRAIDSPRSFTANGLVSALKNTSAKDLLTRREVEVLKALCLVGDIASLARNMNISESTFKTHAGSIYRKLEVRNRASAVKIAREAGLI
jgi:DNA-binding NarL/FixJ family response regulator